MTNGEKTLEKFSLEMKVICKYVQCCRGYIYMYFDKLSLENFECSPDLLTIETKVNIQKEEHFGPLFLHCLEPSNKHDKHKLIVHIK